MDQRKREREKERKRERERYKHLLMGVEVLVTERMGEVVER